MAGTILQQTFVVEYVVNHQMCDDCRRVEAKDTWNASVSFIYKIMFEKYFRLALLFFKDSSFLRNFPMACFWAIICSIFFETFHALDI